MPDDILTLAPTPADARIAYGADEQQFVDLRFPKSAGKHPAPLVMNIHGGYWRAKYNLDHASHVCTALTASGVPTANVEYRRVGNPGGGWPATFDDIRAAYRFLMQNASRHNLDPKKFVVMGHSAGGQLALCLAAHEPSVERVISLAGVLNLVRAYELHLSNSAVVEFLRGTPTEVPEHYREADPMQLAIPQARQVLIHGGDDDVVPPEFSRDYAARKLERKEDVHEIDVPSAGHFDLIDPRTFIWKSVVAKAVTDILG